MNELLMLAEIVAIFSTVLIFKKFGGKYGLIAWVAVAVVMANIQLVKSIDMFGLSATLGNVLFASVFMATDMLSENYGAKYSKKAVKMGILAVLAFILVSQITLAYVPNTLDMANGAMQTLFTLTPRVMIASIIMFAIANFADVYLFEKLKKKFNGKKLWLRNNLCTILTNGLENFGLFFLAFGGVYEVKELIIMACTTTILEIIIAVCDTPFVYLSKKIHCKHED